MAIELKNYKHEVWDKSNSDFAFTVTTKDSIVFWIFYQFFNFQS